MSWDSITGHKRQIGALRTAMERGRLHHALLFSGPEGIGKKLVAKTAASALLCEERPAGERCGECRTCSRIKRGTHADVVTVTRREGERFITIGDNTQPTGNVLHTVRGLCEHASRKPFESKLKVYIIDGAQRIKGEAQDAFLKTLEEPPGNTYFFLVCSNYWMLRETIRSRSMNVPFYPLTADQTSAIVSGLKLESDEQQLAMALLFGEGSPGQAAQFIEQELAEPVGVFLKLADDCAACNTADHSGVFMDKTFSELGSSPLEPIRERLIVCLQSLLNVLRPNRRESCAKVAPVLSELSDEARTDIGEQALKAVTDLRLNVRPQLTIDSLFERIASNGRRHSKAT